MCGCANRRSVSAYTACTFCLCQVFLTSLAAIVLMLVAAAGLRKLILATNIAGVNCGWRLVVVCLFVLERPRWAVSVKALCMAPVLTLSCPVLSGHQKE